MFVTAAAAAVTEVLMGVASGLVSVAVEETVVAAALLAAVEATLLC